MKFEFNYRKNLVKIVSILFILISFLSFGKDEDILDSLEPISKINFQNEFGTVVSPTQGSVHWAFTDFHLPQNGPDISIGRVLIPAEFQAIPRNDRPTEVYDWSLDIPKIYLNQWMDTESMLGACNINSVKNIQIRVC
jgi:hypothetical protein